MRRVQQRLQAWAVGNWAAVAKLPLARQATSPSCSIVSQEHLGASPEELAPIDVSQPAAPLPVPALPPYNGFGSHEDSLQNVKRLIPVQPKKDMYKASK